MLPTKTTSITVSSISTPRTGSPRPLPNDDDDDIRFTPSLPEDSLQSTPSVQNGTLEGFDFHRPSRPRPIEKSETQCTLGSTHKHGWKPSTLSIPVLVGFALLSLILFAAIEVLTQQSERDGGLSLSTSPDDLSNLAAFGYLFLPTIIAVIYSLFWNWVDLDAKRMQAWFEMSRSDGATAGSSILLTYPYQFVGFVPFRALRKQYVFFAGTIMVIILWGITPLQAAILSNGIVTVTRPVEFLDPVELKPAAEHAFLLDQSVLNEAYAVTWLNQSYPAFTTSEYTIMPFQPSPTAMKTTSKHWTGVSTKYWTEIDCWPAEYQLHQTRTYSFNNGQGCNVSQIGAYSVQKLRPYRMLYIGYQSSAFSDYALKNPNCSDDAAHQFLATWSYVANGTALLTDDDAFEDIELEALFCETSYRKQKVQVTIESDTQRPLEESVAEFNITSLEHLLSTGVSAEQHANEREYPFEHLLEQFTHALHLNLTWPMSPLAGFAIGSEKLSSMEMLRNPEALARSFNSTHKLIMSLAFSRLLTNSTNTSSSEGTVTLELHGIVVSRLFASIVESLLGLVAIFSLLLAFFCHKAPSNLTEDPASLGSLMRICHNSSSLLTKFSGMGCLTEEELSESFPDQRLKLLCGCQARFRHMFIKVVPNQPNDGPEDGESTELHFASQDSFEVRGHYTPTRPLVLRRGVGALVLAVLVGVSVFLSYLKRREQLDGGLQRPTARLEVLQLLLSYLPTAFATLFEPFWVLLNRVFCVMQPFKDLWSGQRPAKGSINARYTSVPPQLVLWRAAGARHFILMAICAIALLSNLLAVGLGGLFNQLPVSTLQPRNFEQSTLPRTNRTTMLGLPFMPGFGPMQYEEHFYVMMNNQSLGTSLPPWVGPSHYFQPFEIGTSEASDAEAFTAVTRGFGVQPSCSSAGTHTTNGQGPRLDLNITQDGRVLESCPTSFQSKWLNATEGSYLKPTGPAAIEMVEKPLEGEVHHECNIALILGWARSTEAGALDGETQSSFIVCQPVFTAAMFEVTVDRQGYILDSAQVAEAEAGIDYQIPSNHSATMTIALNNEMAKWGVQRWHNDTLSKDWLNYLLKIQPRGESILDPNADLPDPEDMAKRVDSLYRLMYSLALALNSRIFDRGLEPVIIEGSSHQTEVKIFMPLAAFIISMVVLGLNIIATITVYGIGVKHFLPRMPTTIGSLLAYVAPSRAVRQYGPDTETAEAPRKQPTTFSFGRFVGEDGRAHVGIEMDPYVVPVRLSSLRKGDTKPTGSRLRRAFTRKESSGSGDTWL